MKKFIQILFLSPIIFYSQDYIFTATPSKNKLYIGEPTNIKVSLKLPADKIVDSIYFKLANTNDTLGNNWELWNQSTQTKKSYKDQNDNYFINYEQEFTIANFDTGRFEFPPIVAQADTTSYYSNSLLFLIQLEDIEKNSFIKNIKPIKEVSILWWEYILYFIKIYWTWILGAILILTAFYFIWIKRKSIKEPQKIEEIIDLEKNLLEKLDEIEKKKLWQNGYFKKYYSEICEVLWAFLEHCYKIKTFEKTSNEIIESLKWTSIPNDYLQELKVLFELSDGVKFAKLRPMEKDNSNAIKVTRSLIEKERTDLNKEDKLKLAVDDKNI